MRLIPFVAAATGAHIGRQQRRVGGFNPTSLRAKCTTRRRDVSTCVFNGWHLLSTVFTRALFDDGRGSKMDEIMHMGGQPSSVLNKIMMSCPSIGRNSCQLRSTVVQNMKIPGRFNMLQNDSSAAPLFSALEVMDQHSEVGLRLIVDFIEQGRGYNEAVENNRING